MTTATVYHRRGALALALQEVFTAAVRLRANRQVAADAGSFRTHMKQLVSAADHEARRAGYAGDDVKLAIYAFIVFLDESVLNSPQPMFSDWPRKPLQEEVFGGHMGGEIFFENLRELLGRQDSEDLADVLEVHQLCLLLGFEGRYRVTDKGELRGLMGAVSDKIARIRGGWGTLSPSWSPPAGEAIPTDRDPWNRKLGYLAAGVFTLACLLFVLFDFLLGSGATALQALAPQLPR
jgi:type VI secretion system protein ImpK